jgi:hypothetical protein
MQALMLSLLWVSTCCVSAGPTAAPQAAGIAKGISSGRLQATPVEERDLQTGITDEEASDEVSSFPFNLENYQVCTACKCLQHEHLVALACTGRQI